jgi:hypothetical protein
MIGTAQLNEYSEQHGFEVGADRTLCGVLLSLQTIVRTDLKFGDSQTRPLCAECESRLP